MDMRLGKRERLALRQVKALRKAKRLRAAVDLGVSIKSSMAHIEQALDVVRSRPNSRRKGVSTIVVRQWEWNGRTAGRINRKRVKRLKP